MLWNFQQSINNKENTVPFQQLGSWEGTWWSDTRGGRAGVREVVSWKILWYAPCVLTCMSSEEEGQVRGGRLGRFWPSDGSRQAWEFMLQWSQSRQGKKWWGERSCWGFFFGGGGRKESEVKGLWWLVEGVLNYWGDSRTLFDATELHGTQCPGKKKRIQPEKKKKTLLLRWRWSNATHRVLTIFSAMLSRSHPLQRCHLARWQRCCNAPHVAQESCQWIPELAHLSALSNEQQTFIFGEWFADRAQTEVVIRKEQMRWVWLDTILDT